MGSVLSSCTDYCIEDCMKRDREDDKQAEEAAATTTEVENASPEKKSKPSSTESKISDIACFGAGCYW